MSGSSRRKSPRERLFYGGCLLAVVGVFYASSSLGPSSQGDAALIGAIGFLLLAGTLLSELVEVLGLPHLTGYLLAGVFAGPHVLNMIDTVTVRRLAPVNTLALALIALAGGAELRLDQLKQGVRSLLVATGIHSTVGLLLGGATFLAVRSFIPFARDMSLGAASAVALLWGVLAVSRSPSATLGILAQTRARGPLATFALAFVMSSDVVVILLMALGMMVAKPLLEPGSALSFSAFHSLGHEVLGSISIGTTLGLLLAIYLRLIGRQLIVVLVALGFGASEVLEFLRFDPLLTFLVAGFVVQNLSKQGDKFLGAIEDMGAIVYVVFFASAGADLDVPLLVELWPVALFLSLTRALATFGGARASSWLARDDAKLKAWSWAPLIAQAGLTQGLAGLVEREFPSFGVPFRALVIATLAINAVVGPILFKIALDRSNETRSATPLPEGDEATA
ncbi:MAG: sodium:proton exchanger [Labilithrix sp.]|nr:sodium:proton exchanger [Labilithrix sp.]